MVSITEITRSKSYRIIIDFEAEEWASRELKKAAGGVECSRFSSKYQIPGIIWLLQRYSNEKGIFMSLSEIRGGIVSKEVVIPACKNGEGWLKVAEALLQTIKRPWNMQVNNRALECYGGRKTEKSAQMRKQADTVRMRQDGQVIVCTRENLWYEWASIQEAIGRLFKVVIRMQPFQPDKAVIQCKSEESAPKLGRSKRVLFFEGRAVCLQVWDQSEVMFNRKLAFTGGWIEFTDLPLNWWRREVFEKIGNQCWGLEAVDRRKEEEKCTIRLKVLSKLDLINRGKFKEIPELGVFDRCIIVVVDNNGGQGRGQSQKARETSDVSPMNEATNEGLGIVEMHGRGNEKVGISEGTITLKAGKGKERGFSRVSSNFGPSVSEMEGGAVPAEDMEREYWVKGKKREGDRVINVVGSSYLNLLGPGMVDKEGDMGFTGVGMESGSDEYLR
ncbi:hypothetical protein LguiA_022533 [Lonicera macranthoides]